MQTTVQIQRPVKTKLSFSAKAKKTLRQMKEYRASYVFITPFLLLFITFTVIQVVLSIVLSFTYYNVLEFPRWAGWTNYRRLFVEDEVFMIAIKNTFVYAVITGPLSYILCLLFAWIVNELPGKLKAIMTFVFYAPSISNAFAIWTILFSGDMYGYANSFLLKWGIISEPIQWLTNTKYMMPIFIIVALWLSLGTSFLSMRAGFNTIDKQYFEAAAVDGIRNRWQELWYITLPIMSPHLMFSAVLQITAAFSAGAVGNALFGFPSTNYATHTIMNHLSDYSGTRYERGYAAAIATLLFIAMVGTNKGVQKLIKKVGV